jgi:hypothetical protein
MTPIWLHIVATAMLATAIVTAILIAFDERRHPQKMWIMDVVRPVTALYGTVFATAAYLAYGRRNSHGANSHGASSHGADGGTPFAVSVGKATAHCGSGCTIGDLLAEWLAYFLPGIAIAFGWKSIFAEKIFSVWIIDFILAFSFGIVFQYYTIVPMRKLSPGQGIVAAFKADALSLTAWQVGMYGFMAFAQFYLFRRVLGVPLEVNSVEFWLMMQIAMIFGFITSYPVNWFLVRAGIKEEM